MSDRYETEVNLKHLNDEELRKEVDFTVSKRCAGRDYHLSSIREQMNRDARRIVELEAQCQSNQAELWDTTKRAEKAEAALAELKQRFDARGAYQDQAERWRDETHIRAKKAEAEREELRKELMLARNDTQEMERLRDTARHSLEVQGIMQKQRDAALEERDAALYEIVKEQENTEEMPVLRRERNAALDDAALKDKMLGDCGDAIKMWCDLVKEYYDVGREIIDMWDGKEGACVEIRVIEKLRAVLGDD